MLSIKGSILPYNADIDMHKDEMEVDDIHEIVSNECHNFAGSVQSLVSMKKIRNISKQTSILKSIDSQSSIPSTTTVPSQDIIVPIKKARGRPHKNPQQETAIVYYSTKPDATLKEAQQTLTEKFKISITQSGLQKHLVSNCGLTMKKLEQISEYCNSDETIAAHMNWAYAFKSSGIDYYKCIYIDKAGFNMHIKHNFGGITGKGIVNLSLRRLQAVVSSKKHKLCSGEEKVMGKISIWAEHYIDFLKVLI
ncbi:hypothetical protein BDC45DRAFT_566623 [Circinella umbellata]|nr:hypothetical protein BDC45DRAFT_566623 [Circinella umbellata]